MISNLSLPPTPIPTKRSSKCCGSILRKSKPPSKSRFRYSVASRKHEFIRVHPHLEINVSAIELKEDSDGGIYLVAANMAAALSGEANAYVLRPYVNRAGVLRLWPLRLPDPDGKQNPWHRPPPRSPPSKRWEGWIRVTANRSAGEYEVFEAPNQPPPPEWPATSLPDMLRLAFTDRGRVIQDAEHPVVKQLLGRL